MGREIRRVPKGWEHPRQQCKHSPWAGGCTDAKRNGGMCYQPLYDRDFETHAVQWLADCADWEANNPKSGRAEWEAEEGERKFFWEYDGDPPDRTYYRPKWSDEERTCYQMYETVSEGTPVSPVFETKEALVDYLVNYGDFWDQFRAQEEGGPTGWKRENAEAFVKHEWAPSMIAIRTGDSVEIRTARDGI